MSGDGYGRVLIGDGRGYLIPRISRRAAAAATDLYNAQRAGPRVAKACLKAALRVGIAQMLLPTVSLTRSQDSLSHGGPGDILGYLKGIWGQSDLTFAISLGTPGVHRKPVIQVLTRNGEVLGYAKVGWNDLTNALVQNEVEILSKLGERETGLRVPEVLHSGEWQERFVCVLSGHNSAADQAPSKMGLEYLQVLEELASLHTRWRSLEESPHWHGLADRVACVRSSYYRHLLARGMDYVRRVLGQRLLPFHLRHGDLAPWNAQRVDGRLFLFDWEYADWEAIPGYDLFHFMFQTLWLLERRTAGETYRCVIGKIEEQGVSSYWSNVKLDQDAYRPLLLLYLLDQLSFYAAQETPNLRTLLRLAMLVNLCVYRKENS